MVTCGVCDVLVHIVCFIWRILSLCQAWDNNLISNDAIGERVIPMTAFLKRAYMAQVNKLKAAKAPAASAGSKPPKRPPIRPLGNGGDNVARFPKKGKKFKGDGNPTYWAEL